MSNISRILKESKRPFSQKTDEIKNLSNQTIHSATIHQDPVNIVIAVLVYSLAKYYKEKIIKKWRNGFIL